MTRTGNPKTLAAVLALAVAVALMVLLATKPADAASRFKVVTRTFSSTST